MDTKAARIRALAERGWKRADIARELGVRYQYVRNVLERPGRQDKAEPRAGQRVRVRVEDGGRIVLPAAFRSALGIKPGDRLLVWFEDGAIHLQTVNEAIRQAQALVRRYIPDDGRSLVDELIAERRREAEAEFGR